MDISYFYKLVSGLNPNAALIISGIIAGIVAILGSILGSLITGRFMIRQNKDNYKYNLHIIDAEERRLENAVLQALETEIRVNWERYKEFVQPYIEKLSKDAENINAGKNHQDNSTYFHKLLSQKISISRDYFTIYNGNSSFIGKIRNKNLRKEIVSVYTNIKGHLELISLNDMSQTSLDDLILEIKKIKIHQDNLDSQIEKLKNSFKEEIENINKEINANK